MVLRTTTNNENIPEIEVCLRVRHGDLGPDYFDRINPGGLRRRLTKRLEGLGFKVTLEPVAQVA